MNILLENNSIPEVESRHGWRGPFLAFVAIFQLLKKIWRGTDSSGVVPTNDDDLVKLPSSRSETADFIIEDLDKAISMMTP